MSAGEPFPPAGEQPAGTDDWMHLSVHGPRELIADILVMLTKRHGFRDIAPIDWCALEREQDYAHVDYAPAEEPANRYVIDWRRGETCGDITFEVEDPAARTTAAACRNVNHGHFPGDPVLPSCIQTSS